MDEMKKTGIPELKIVNGKVEYYLLKQALSEVYRNISDNFINSYIQKILNNFVNNFKNYIYNEKLLPEF